MKYWKTKSFFIGLICLGIPTISEGEASRPKRKAPPPSSIAPPEGDGKTELSPTASSDCAANPVCMQLTVRAKELSQAGQHTQALDAYQGAFALYPSPWLLLNIGRLQYKLGRPQEAVITLRRALAQTPVDQIEKRQRLQIFLAAAEQAAVSTLPPGSPQGPQVIQLPPPPPPIPSTPLYKRWQLWTVLGSGLAVGASALAAGLLLRPFDPGDRQVFHLSSALVIRIP